jgi:hypothetical protein
VGWRTRRGRRSGIGASQTGVQKLGGGAIDDVCRQFHAATRAACRSGGWATSASAERAKWSRADCTRRSGTARVRRTIASGTREQLGRGGWWETESWYLTSRVLKFLTAPIPHAWGLAALGFGAGAGRVRSAVYEYHGKAAAAWETTGG